MKLTHPNALMNAAVAFSLTVGLSATAAAQRGHAAAPAMAHMPATHAPSATGRPADAGAPTSHTTFNGIAKKLNTTPDALQSAYDAAKADNPKLTLGQFIAANVLAQNLGSKDAAITTDAILAGLKGGKSIGQTLQSLGLSQSEAQEAEQTADKEAEEAGAPTH